MKWFKNLRIGVKLYLSFLLIAFIACYIGYKGINEIKDVGSDNTLLYEKVVIPTSYLADMTAYFQRARSITRDVIFLNNPKEIEDEIQNVGRKHKTMQEAMDNFEKHILNDEIRTSFNTLIEINKTYLSRLENVFQLARQNKDAEAYALLNTGEFDDLVMKETKQMENLISLERNKAKEISESNTLHANSSTNVITSLLIIGIILAIGLSALFAITIGKKTEWYETMLDAIPMPMSVTDMEMNWTFINKPVEKFLGVSRKKVLGRQCSEWNAKICKTENCGVEKLRRNQPVTFFEQMGGYFRVDSSYILDTKGKKIGHIEFVQDITSLSNQSKLITKASNELLKISEESADSSEQISSKSSVAASSSEEISASINSVASASEEMASSIKEISKNTGTASTITKDATVKANSANEVMQRLGISSSEIGNIIKSITSIAEQTNLLALNATIEAARAGESGKGFAVVANEVKELAKESARATEDITHRIKMIQDDSNNAIQSIREIIEIIQHINDVTNTIASAVEEQSVTVGEVNRNISEASVGINSVSDSVSGVASTAHEYANLSNNVKILATDLKTLSDSLENQLNAK
jgi:PAS domain S-box-containing protein